jgi:hypothetical protein
MASAVSMVFTLKVSTSEEVSLSEATEIVQKILGQIETEITLQSGKTVVIGVEIVPETDAKLDPAQAFRAGAEEAQDGRSLREGLLNPKQFP